MDYPGNLMGLGYMSVGAGVNTSSSTSNLSALAPPFTVDKFNPMLNSNPVFHYSDMAYNVEPFARTSQFSGPSAPGAELDINLTSTGIASMPFNDYEISASSSARQSGSCWSAPSPSVKFSGSSFAYGGEVKPYYSSGVPPMIGEHNTVIEDYGWPYKNVMPPSGLNVSSQLDEPQWVDNMGFNVGKWVKNVEPSGSFSTKNENVGGSDSYESEVSQGRDSILFGQKSQGIVSSSEVHARSFRVGNSDDKSCLDQNFNSLPYYSMRIHTYSSSSMLPESHYSGPCSEMIHNFSGSQNSCSPYLNCGMSVDSSLSSFVSSTRSSPAVVIRPPPANDVSGKSVAYNHIQSDNAAVVRSTSFDHSSSSNLKDHDFKPIPDIKEDSIPLSLVKEFPNPSPIKDTSHHKIKARFGPQLPNINVSCGLPVAFDSIQVANSADDSLDLVDHLNPVVDSPCWKGAPSSQLQAFDSGSENPVKKNFNFDRDEHENLLSLADSSRTFSKKFCEGYNNGGSECDRNHVLMLESTLDANCSSREMNLSDGAARVGITAMTSDEFLRTEESITSRNESNFSNHLKGGYEMNFFDAKNRNVEAEAAVILNDISEGGTVAVHAAEKVLASPPMEFVTGCSKLLPDAKLDFQTMIKVIHNLSELLHCSLSNDMSALEEKNTEILKNTISNLDACMTKKIDLTGDKLKSKSHFSDISEEHGKFHYVGAVSTRHDRTNESMNSHLDYQNMHGGNKNNIFFTNKSVKSPTFSSLNAPRDDDDKMTKAIKSILNENFHCNEEIHLQALIFKNLWLEAEAKLCSTSYISRFHRMKIEMEKLGMNSRKENEGVEVITPEVFLSHHPNTSSTLTDDAHDISSSKPTTRNTFTSNTTEEAEDLGSSIMARFNILKSREDNNLKLTSTEPERKSKIVEGENSGSIVASKFNTLRSIEDKVTSNNMEKEHQLEMAGGAQAGSITSRFTILKSRGDKAISGSVHGQDLVSKSVVSNILRPKMGSSGFIVEEELLAQIANGELPGKNQPSFMSNQSIDEVFYPTPKLHFSHHSGFVRDGNYGSYVDGGFRHATSRELHISAASDPITHLYNRRFHGSGTCSDWEHIQKDDFAWTDM